MADADKTERLNKAINKSVKAINLNGAKYNRVCTQMADKYDVDVEEVKEAVLPLVTGWNKWKHIGGNKNV